MTGTEERLRAALAAKADTVTHADLRHPLPPSAGRATHRLRRAALLTLAAALIGAALALPGALRHQTDQRPAIRPHPTVSPSPRPAPVPVTVLPSVPTPASPR